MYFTDKHVQRIRQSKQRPPLKDAWEYLISAEDDLLILALRFQLNADMVAGEAALTALKLTSITDVREALMTAQCLYLLRDHPQFEDDLLTKFVQAIVRPEDEQLLPETVWWAAVDMAIGILTEDKKQIETQVTFFKNVINEEVHPEGYLPKAVEIAPEAAALEGQIKAVQGLVLMAEMADHVGYGLWHYEQRGVSILTATTYPLYYYFYPEKWPWNGEKWKPSDGVEEDVAQAIFKQYAGFLEMIAPRYDKSLKAVEMILDELRPIYDVYGGGLVTLTHAIPKRRGLFG